MTALAIPPDASAADWLVGGVRDSDGTVGSLVPARFEAYARVLHPASRWDGEDAHDVRWAAVAQANERVLHAAAEWESLVWQAPDQHSIWEQAPATGRLAESYAMRLVAALARHSSTPDRCFFAVWEGWGTPSVFGFAPPGAELQLRESLAVQQAAVDAWSALLASTPRFELPGRGMHLLAGPAAALLDFYSAHREPPSVWWPQDRAWCVAGDVDLMATYVGASRAAIGALLAESGIEALEASVDQGITWESDTINPRPPAYPRR